MRPGVTLLDGGMGNELGARGVDVPSHVTSIWSAKALVHAPEAVLKLHRDYIEAGADVITANNYAVTPPLLAREGLADRFEELTLLAADLARRARDQSGRDVRIAGSMPPLETSYRADLVGPDDVILADYRRMAAALAPRVDLLLCETMASAREGVAAATAAAETDREVWLSWTLQGRRANHLPSGESLADAFAAAAHLDVGAWLVNCCAADFVTRAVPVLQRLTARPVGGYANPYVVDTGEGRPLNAGLAGRLLGVEGYAAEVARWIDAGARIVGGCCETGPAHIARLRAML